MWSIHTSFDPNVLCCWDSYKLSIIYLDYDAYDTHVANTCSIVKSAKERQNKCDRLIDRSLATGHSIQILSLSVQQWLTCSALGTVARPIGTGQRSETKKTMNPFYNTWSQLAFVALVSSPLILESFAVVLLEERSLLLTPASLLQNESYIIR